MCPPSPSSPHTIPTTTTLTKTLRTTTTTRPRPLTAAEVETCFSYCDVAGEGRGLTAAGLRTRLAPLLLAGGTGRNVDTEALLGEKAVLTLEDLKAALLPPQQGEATMPGTTTVGGEHRHHFKDGSSGGADPVAEAFALMATTPLSPPTNTSTSTAIKAGASPQSHSYITREALAGWLRAVEGVRATDGELE